MNSEYIAYFWVCGLKNYTFSEFCNEIETIKTLKKTETWHICYFCKRRWDTFEERKYCNTMHIRQRVYICEKCGLSFDNKINSKKHRIICVNLFGSRNPIPNPERSIVSVPCANNDIIDDFEDKEKIK
jgi:hypothetical protein